MQETAKNKLLESVGKVNLILYLQGMKAKIYISGRITKGETLVDVIRQYKSFEDVTEIEAVIDSNGGNKNEGEAIFDYLKNLDAEIPVITKTGKAYSIAAKIFAAGSTRIIEDVDDALMIHFARAKTEGTAEELEEIAAELRVIENDFIEFYSEHLDIDEETVRNLLDNETFVSGKDAVELGFATEVEAVAEIIAELYIEKSNIDKMTDKKKIKSKGQKLLDAMAEFVGIEIEGKAKPEINAELTLQDSNATDIVFPDLESGDTPKVDDKATIDGSAIPDGSYIMPSLEDSTVVFVDGKVSEIIPKEEEEEEEETEAEKEARLAKEAEVVAEEIKEVVTWSVNTSNTSFEEGETLMFEGWDGGEDYSASAGEFKLNDGRSVVTDASGVIVKVVPADSGEQILETEASFEDLKEKMSLKIKAEIKAEHEAAISEKDKEIKALKKAQGSKEINSEAKEIPNVKKDKGSRAAQILRAAREE
jgi:ATP-dependent protease ClpP protease subunit